MLILKQFKAKPLNKVYLTRNDKQKSRKGLFTWMRESVSFMIIDRDENLKYKYENSEFIKLKINQTVDNFMKCATLNNKQSVYSKKKKPNNKHDNKHF
jgi:hypothetical protein